MKNNKYSISIFNSARYKSDIESYPKEEVFLEKLCSDAGIKNRVTSCSLPQYFFNKDSDNNYKMAGVYVAGIKKFHKLKKENKITEQEFAVRILEIFAYAFLDYSVRECVCGKNIFDGKLELFDKEHNLINK